MKSEERHELKENALQSWLQYGLPIFLKQNGSYILLAAALCLLGYTLWNKHKQNVQITAENASRELYDSETSQKVEHRDVKLQSIIEQYDVKPVRAVALRDLGNYYNAIVAAGTTDDSANAKRTDVGDALSKAESNYRRILTEFPNESLAAGAARLNLGTVAENKGDWDGAQKIYEQLSADKSDPAIASVAALRLGEKDPATGKWKGIEARKNAPRLSELTPPTTTPAAPRSQMPGSFLPAESSSQPR